MKIETYQLKTKSGKPIRKTTKITLESGETLYFTEKLTKKEAHAQTKIYGELTK